MKISTAALLASLTLASAAHADVLTYEYTAKINHLYKSEWMNYDVPIANTTLPGYSLNVGDEITGRFSIDTLTPLSYSVQYDGVSSSYYKGSAHNQMFLNIGQDGLKYASAYSDQYGPSVSVQDSGPAHGVDSVTLASSISDAQGTTFLSLSFSDLSGAALNGTGIPASLSALNTPKFGYTFFSNAGFQAITMDVGFTSMNLVSVSAVPEPGTYLMFLAGLPLLAWRRRAARQ